MWPKPAGFLIFQDTPVNSSPSKEKNTPRFITAYDHFLTPFLFLDNFYKETDERCTCPVPCETISFNPVLSFATFPSEKYITEATNKHVGNVSKEERLKFREFIRYKTGRWFRDPHSPKGRSTEQMVISEPKQRRFGGTHVKRKCSVFILGQWFSQMFVQFVFMRLKALGNTNLEALWQIKKERDSLPLDARRSKTPFLPIYKNGRRVELVQKLIMSKAARLDS